MIPRPRGRPSSQRGPRRWTGGTVARSFARRGASLHSGPCASRHPALPPARPAAAQRLAFHPLPSELRPSEPAAHLAHQLREPRAARSSPLRPAPRRGRGRCTHPADGRRARLACAGSEYDTPGWAPGGSFRCASRTEAHCDESPWHGAEARRGRWRPASVTRADPRGSVRPSPQAHGREGAARSLRCRLGAYRRTPATARLHRPPGAKAAIFTWRLLAHLAHPSSARS